MIFFIAMDTPCTIFVKVEAFVTHLRVLEAGLALLRLYFRPEELHRHHRDESLYQSIHTLAKGTNFCLKGPHVPYEHVNLGNQGMAKAQRGERCIIPREVLRCSLK